MADQVLWPLVAVSSDPTNVTKLDANNNVLTSTTDIAASFVQKAGDTMTGQLIAQAGVSIPANASYTLGADPASTTISNDTLGVFTLSVGGLTARKTAIRFTPATGNIEINRESNGTTNIGGNITATGTTHNFAQGSIPSTAFGPLLLLTEVSAAATLLATDAGKVLVAAPPAGSDFTMNLPASGTAGIRPGMVVELVSNIPSVGKYLFVQAPAGVSLFYNSTVGGSGDGTLGGGIAAKCRLRGPLTSVRLLAVDSATWWAFGDLVTA